MYVCVCVCASVCEWVGTSVAKRVGGLGIAPKRTAVQLRRPLTHVLCDMLLCASVCVCPLLLFWVRVWVYVYCLRLCLYALLYALNPHTHTRTHTRAHTHTRPRQPLCPIFRRSLFETNFPHTRPDMPATTRRCPLPAPPALLL